MSYKLWKIKKFLDEFYRIDSQISSIFLMNLYIILLVAFFLNIEHNCIHTFFGKFHFISFILLVSISLTLLLYSKPVQFICEYFKKSKYVSRKRRALNKDNPLSFNFLDRLTNKIEFNLKYKFVAFTLGIVIFIHLFDYVLSNHIINWVSYLNPEYTDYHLSDNDSARYFFSAVTQSLAALLAISFSILLIYLQMSVDKYSIHTVKDTLGSKLSVIVIITFLFTMIYSFFELLKIKNGLDGNVIIYTNDSSLITIFLLTLLCFFLLILFLYRTMNSLSPDYFIQNSSNRIKKSFVTKLNFLQDMSIKYNYFKEEINNIDNIEEGNLYDYSHSLDFQYSIKPKKYGLIQDIDVLKYKKCSKLLHYASNESKLRINVPKNWRIKSSSNILGYIEYSNNYNITREIEKLVIDAYNINKQNVWVVEDYKKLSPISSFIMNAIKTSEKDLFEVAFEEFVSIIIEYSKSKRYFLVMDSFTQIEDIFLGKSFLDEFFDKIDEIAKVSIDESDLDTTNLIIFFNKQIGYESINLQDKELFNKVINFYFYFSYKFGGNFIERILHESDLLEMKVVSDLRNEKNNLGYIYKSKSFLTTIIEHYENISTILIDKQLFLVQTCFYKILDIRRNIEDFSYDNEYYNLTSKLMNLETNVHEQQIIKKKIEVIKEKEKMSHDLQLFLNQRTYSLGIYLMLNLESNKLDIEFVKPIFEIIADILKGIDLEDILLTFSMKDLFRFDHWNNNIEDYQAHIIKISPAHRFYILINALMIQKGKDLKKIKTTNWLNQTQLDKFKNEFDNLIAKSNLWDKLVNNSNDSFLQVLETLKEYRIDREEILHQSIKLSALSSTRVEQVSSNITAQAKMDSYARMFVKVEEVSEDSESFFYFGINILYDKIFFVDDVDPTTDYCIDDIGADIGRNVGNGESEYISRIIFEQLDVARNRIQVDNVSLRTLSEAKKKLIERGFNPNSLLISSDLAHKLLMSKELSISNKESGKLLPFGFIDEIDVYRVGIIPKEVAILFDKDNIGTLKLLNDLSPLITSDFDKDEIIKKELETNVIKDEEKDKRLKELDSKVNIKAIEKIYFEFEDQNAGLVLSIISDD